MKTPFRCFKGTAEPYQPFWNMVEAEQSESGMAELEMYGVISEYSWFEDDITPGMFRTELYEKGKGGPVLLKINSPGGDIIAASMIRAIITDYPGEVFGRIDGMAASAAVMVAISANKLSIFDSAYMMIHDPAVVVFLASLDINTLGSLHKQLSDIKLGLVNAYESKTGLGKVRIARMMADETWMSAATAVEYGFADEVITGGKTIDSKNVAFVNCLQGYSKVPEAVMNIVNTPSVDDSSTSVMTEDMKREAETLRESVSKILLKGH